MELAEELWSLGRAEDEYFSLGVQYAYIFVNKMPKHLWNIYPEHFHKTFLSTR